MIFPPVRLSDLQKDAELKKQRLTTSLHVVQSSIREYSNPLTWLKKHPKLIIGSAASAMSAMKLIGKFFPNNKKESKKSSTIQNKWMQRLVSFVGMMVIKRLMPVATESVLGIIGSFGKKGRSR